jgi:hypothetical protein
MMQEKVKGELEHQQDREESRNWIRKFNSSLYDNKIKRMILESSNGANILQKEIKVSTSRLRSVKSGASLHKICPSPHLDFFTPSLETYFKGHNRTLRDAATSKQQDPAPKNPIFITEAEQQAPQQKPSAFTSLRPSTSTQLQPTPTQKALTRFNSRNRTMSTCMTMPFSNRRCSTTLQKSALFQSHLSQAEGNSTLSFTQTRYGS